VTSTDEPRIGHPLPEFPDISHGNAPGLKPFNTIGKAIARIPRHADWHLGSVSNYAEPKAATSFDRPAPCITTGNTPPHPDGLRPFSVRELAALNGFPSDFKFPSSSEVNMGDLRTQIGNAVPPLIWQKFAAKVDQCLNDFRSGKIDEAGQPIPLQATTDPVRGAVNGMRQLSVEPNAARPRSQTLRRQRSRSVTLSPDPPVMQVSTFASDTGRVPLAPRKRRAFFEISDDDDTITATTRSQLQKKMKKQEPPVDLTKDD
jgi:hypothetical protein